MKPLLLLIMSRRFIPFFARARVRPFLPLLSFPLLSTTPSFCTTPQRPHHRFIATASPPIEAEKALCEEFNSLYNESDKCDIFIRIFTHDGQNSTNIKILGDFKNLLPKDVHHVYKIIMQNVVFGDKSAPDFLSQVMIRNFEEYNLASLISRNSIRSILVDTTIHKYNEKITTSVLIPLDEPIHHDITLSFNLEYSFIIKK